MHFVMKISKLCNLRCRYCYEYDELDRPERMPLERLRPFFASVADWWRSGPAGPPPVFVLHGGEPLLLPVAYVRAFAEALHDALDPAGVPFAISVQTNLTRVDPDMLALLEEFRISLGVSLDVFGGERVTAGGRDAQPRVLDNLQSLFDSGAADRLGVGAISVIHRGNVAHAERTFAFYRELGLSYRMLPVFALADPPARMRHLTLGHDEVLDAFMRVADAYLASDAPIRVYPLVHFMQAAVDGLAGAGTGGYDPRVAEWALIVDTNGDAYSHAEAYTPDGLMGNVFAQPLAEIMDGPGRRRAIAVRMERATLCDACPHGRSCSRLPIVESLPSERRRDADGRLECAIARPMIDHLTERIRRDPRALELVEARRGEERAVAVT